MTRKDAGHQGRRWRRLTANLRAQHRPCWLCGQPIDYTAGPDSPDSFHVDHIKPKSTHPELAEDPSNLAAAHARCNTRRGRRAPAPALGATSQQW